MPSLTHHQTVLLLLNLGIMLALARFLGELAKRYHQPAVVGELLAGILLGPTLFGRVWPEGFQFLFRSEPNTGLVLNGLVLLSAILFLLVAGMEFNLSVVWKQSQSVLGVALLGIGIPFVTGYVLALYAPSILGYDPGPNPLVFQLFLATALSISALPVIAKTLMDLNLYHTDMGMIILTAAIFDDLAGWLIFSVVLGLMDTGATRDWSVGYTITFTLCYAGFMLTLGRKAIHRALPWIQANSTWTGGVLGFALSLAFFGAAFTEWIGIHAIFGSFLVGVALGDSSHLKEQARGAIERFISYIFAPLFFCSIGLKVDFGAYFDLRLTLVLFVVACLVKIIGCFLGARLSGIHGREAWAIGFGLNSRGAMEIILGVLALQYGVIREPFFVALVIMALGTSLMSGPLIQKILKQKIPVSFTKFISPKAFIIQLEAQTAEEAIEKLTLSLCQGTPLDPLRVSQILWSREEAFSTGLPGGLAIPHARLEGLDSARLAVALCPQGVDFNASDGKPSHLICLILTPKKDNGLQLDILADLSKTFIAEGTVDQILRVKNFTEFLAFVKGKKAGEVMEEEPVL